MLLILLALAYSFQDSTRCYHQQLPQWQQRCW